MERDWIPSKTRTMVPGRSDYEGSSIQRRELKGPNLTTYSRAHKHVKTFWAEKQKSQRYPETNIAGKNRQKLNRSNIRLGDYNAFRSFDDPVELLEEQERPRTRGIVGFTGKQPSPHQLRPPLPPEDPSRMHAINGQDSRKPWSKGIVGYTGHQPKALLKRSIESEQDVLYSILHDAIDIKQHRRSSQLHEDLLGDFHSVSEA